MIKKENIKYYAPIVFFLLMLIDAHITKIMETWTNNIYFANSHLLLLAFLLIIQKVSKNYLLVSAIILGILCDIYYIGIIGIYTVALPVTVMLMFYFRKTVQTNLFTTFFSIVIFITIYELISVFLQIIFHLSSVRPLLFITRVLSPTLLLNMLFFVIFSYPIKKLFSEK